MNSTVYDVQLRLVTSHFSALPENAALRSRQYRSCLSFLSSSTRHSPFDNSGSSKNKPGPVRVFLGDTNASSPDELELLREPPLSLVDAITIAPGADDDDCGRASPPHPHRRRKRKREGNEPSRSSSGVASHVQTLEDERERGPGLAEEEASFRSRPTFGHLYPYVHASARGRRRPRKVRRIDRVYVSGPSSSATLDDHDSAVVVRCTLYRHLGGEPLVGEEERDRLGRDGRRFASDHEAVLVELGLSFPGAA